jgi:hypothetical protein
MTFKLTNGHTAQILFDWGNGVIQFAYTDAEGTIKIIRAKRADWEA